MLLVALANDIGGPLVMYFSYIVLGLLMVVGYIIYRAFGRRKRDDRVVELEQALRQAEAEARALKAQREGKGEALAPDEAHQHLQAQVRRMVDEHDRAHGGDRSGSGGDAGPGQGDAPPREATPGRPAP